MDIPSMQPTLFSPRASGAAVAPVVVSGTQGDVHDHDVKQFVVFYLLKGHYRATRHVAGCGVLARAQSMERLGVPPFPSGGRDKITDHHIVTDEVYGKLPSHYPTPKDHSCLR